jgi:hypothetical protein
VLWGIILAMAAILEVIRAPIMAVIMAQIVMFLIITVGNFSASYKVVAAPLQAAEKR